MPGDPLKCQQYVIQCPNMLPISELKQQSKDATSDRGKLSEP